MLATKIGSVAYDGCLFNAAGPKCSTGEELDALRKEVEKGKGYLGGYVSKSMTCAYREGNKGLRYVDTGWGSINSMGLPNEGCAFYKDYYQRFSGKDGEDGKMILSVSGMSSDNNLIMLLGINDMGWKMKKSVVVELNLSCPNLVGKSQIGYDFEEVRLLLWNIRKKSLQFIELGLKLPPYFDMAHFKKIGNIVKMNSDIVSFVVCVNSIGNGLVVDFEKESVVIEPKKGFGGIGGDFLLPTALANVRKFYQMVGNVVDVVGVGGVKSGKEAFLHILCGARAVQIGTALMREDVGVFERIGRELEEIMKARGYKCIEDFRGKLKELGGD